MMRAAATGARKQTQKKQAFHIMGAAQERR